MRGRGIGKTFLFKGFPLVGQLVYSGATEGGLDEE